MQILVTGGTFDDLGGRTSSLVTHIAEELMTTDTVTMYNGGNYSNIETILASAKDYDAVLWWANIPNDKPKLRDVKSVNPRAMLVTSKRNDNETYSIQELIHRALQTKSNLCVEFSRQGDNYKMMLFDPLGNAWYDGFAVPEFAAVLRDRLEYLSKITRKRCIPAPDMNLPVPDETEFFGIVKNYAEVFHHLIHPEEGVTRFLGNSSFRCERGFPSFRSGDAVFVSRRNVDKRCIEKDGFVPTKLTDTGDVYYGGEHKPSVDTPIQLQLYRKYPQINYMIHAHVYIEDAPYTKRMVPCGGLEEVDEIVSVIQETDCPYNDFFAINLTGHGCIVMSSDTEQLKHLPFRGRPVPERHELFPAELSAQNRMVL